MKSVAAVPMDRGGEVLGERRVSHAEREEMEGFFSEFEPETDVVKEVDQDGDNDTGQGDRALLAFFRRRLEHHRPPARLSSAAPRAISSSCPRCGPGRSFCSSPTTLPSA